MTTSYNPWTVNSVHEFWFLHCPECPFNTKEEEFFQAHAIENHPASLALFGKIVKEEALDNSYEYKENNLENNRDYGEAYENQTPIESFYVASISPEIQIKEEFVENYEENEQKSFSAITGLKLHTDNVHEAIRYNCSKCDKTFSQMVGLTKHNDSFHEGIRYNCEKCEKSFTQKYHLNVHFQVVHEEKKSDALLKDQIKKEKKKMKAFNCLLCDRTFSRVSKLKVHTESVHEEKKVICSNCGIVCSSKEGLRRHNKTIHEGIKRTTINKINVCPICGKNVKISLKIHIESVHEGKKPFKCSLCDAAFGFKYGLNMHILSVHEKKKPFKCSKCEFEATQKSNLKRHEETVHEGIKSHKCTICGAAFGIAGSLKRHIESVHEHEGIKPYKCSICDAAFGLKQNLSKHMDSVHLRTEKIKPHACTICDSRFAKKENLNSHIKVIHLKIKPFTCSFCNHSFSKRGHMNTHIASVHEGKNNSQVQNVMSPSH